MELSAKERWVLFFSEKGLTDQEIGKAMRLSPFSVSVFLENARTKLLMRLGQGLSSLGAAPR